ncbi:ExbD/TolR family protein [Inhella gelatinilytica]|uniref:Biopolymer transporter ExbD n=1 Tax=Inhella gelatinilytica TaxID=2795030 RepID=A0A931NG07_9BURK|nr:biopolymer transporter ExbD [Inhella gelatinilytica]MBH9554091.1 biopolymer transporter ExbD [Inhella gelatinilytica]
MKFRAHKREEPEINLIPFIDVLLVVLIFLMLSTTFSPHTALQIRLPQAGQSAAKAAPHEVVIAITPDGRYAVDGHTLGAVAVDGLEKALRAQTQGQTDVQVVIAADALTPHQLVMNAMDAARRAGFGRIAFAAQQQPQ